MNNHYTKLTDENMIEYEAFVNAVKKYAKFLLKKRGLGSQRTTELMIPKTRMIIIDESFITGE